MTQPGSRGVRVGRTLRTAMALFGLVGMLGAAYAFLRIEDAAQKALPTVTIDERGTPSVVMAIKALSRLESVTFHVERVVDVKRTERALWGMVEAEDSILLVAAGDVVAGVDLGKLGPGSIVVDEAKRSVRIELPAPEVFSSRLDNARTYVHSRQTDVLASRDHTLETEARQRAERTIHDGAIEAGILEHAERSAGSTLRALASSFGYRDVVVVVAKGGGGTEERGLAP